MRENTTAKYKSQTARLTEMANTQFLVNNFVVKNEFSTGAKFDSSTRNETNQQMMKYFLGRFECFRFTLLTDVFQSFVCAWRRSVYVLSNVGKRRGVTKWLPWNRSHLHKHFVRKKISMKIARTFGIQTKYTFHTQTSNDHKQIWGNKTEEKRRKWKWFQTIKINKSSQWQEACTCSSDESSEDDEKPLKNLLTRQRQINQFIFISSSCQLIIFLYFFCRRFSPMKKCVAMIVSIILSIYAAIYFIFWHFIFVCF